MKLLLVLSERHRKIIGENFVPKFDPNLWAIRVNILKISVEKMKKIFEEKNYNLEQIPWLKEGFWIRTKNIISKEEEQKLGYFFIQNASSMIPPLVLEPDENDIVLDLSASPGAKTTQIAAMMKNKGKIIANDINPIRLRALKANLQRCGVKNTIVTEVRGEYFWKRGERFNKILLDAPCTGTGTLNPRILKKTGKLTIRRLSELQKRLLKSAAKSLETGGTLVYSTCSLEPEENEAIVDYGIKKLGLHVGKINLEIPKEFTFRPLLEWGNKKFDESILNSFRILPTEKTEGFFVCKLSS